jgi:hypothetical protein
MPERAPEPIVHIIGRVGQDPKPVRNGDGVAFTVAVTTQTGKEQGTRWYDVSAWRDPLKSAVQQNIRKGSHVGVSGLATVKEGTSRTFYGVLANDIFTLAPLGGTGKPQPRPYKEEDEF